MAELQARSKLGKGSKRPSDGVEGLRFEITWEAQKSALGVSVSPENVKVEEGELMVVSPVSLLVPVLLSGSPPIFFILPGSPFLVSLLSFFRGHIDRKADSLLLLYRG